jgi:ADP-ribosylglycohydrolase
MALPADHEQRMRRARLCLDGALVGDAFSERVSSYEGPVAPLVSARRLPASPWPQTGDAELVSGVLDVLDAHGAIDRDALAKQLAERYRRDLTLAYEDNMHWVLACVSGGLPWKDAAEAALEIEDSFDDSASVRSTVIGAYFADDLDAVAREARANAETTHPRPDAHHGAVVIATAAAIATRMGEKQVSRSGAALIEAAIGVAHGPLRERLERAKAMLKESPAPEDVRKAFAQGNRIPSAIYWASKAIGDFTDALWSVAPDQGSRDSTPAMTAALVALANGEVPADWLRARIG